jgi:hypothetical protein
MLQFRTTLDEADRIISVTDTSDGVSWRARIMRKGCITREIAHLCPDRAPSPTETQMRLEQEVREAVAWFEGRQADHP